MASCGPSNPLQSAKDHLQRDTTLQRDQVAAAAPWQSAGFRRAGPGGEQTAAQFDAFNQFAPGLDAAGQPLAAEGLPRGAVGYISEHQPLAQRGQQWAAEFQQHQPSHQHQQQQHSHQQQQQHQLNSQQVGVQGPAQQGTLMALAGPRAGAAPQWSAPYAMQATGGAAATAGTPQRAAPAPPSDAAFEEVFAAFEKKLEAEQAAQQAGEAPKQSEDLSAVAAQIMSTLNSADSERSAQLAEKIQSSKFMALMDKLKSSEVTAGESEFVESGGAKVDPYALSQTSVPVSSNEKAQGPSAVHVDMQARATEDWPPQRRDPSAAPFGRGWKTAKYLQGLDDPDTYFRKLRQSLEFKTSRVGGMPSSFEVAQDLAPQPVHVGDWEERYEQW